MDVRNVHVAGMRYNDLPLDVRTIFDAYPIDVVIVEDAAQNDQEDEVRDMFLRLQNGTILKAQEKRNAMTGSMRDFVKAIAKHPFLKNAASRTRASLMTISAPRPFFLNSKADRQAFATAT